MKNLLNAAIAALRGEENSSPDLFVIRYAGTTVVAVDTRTNGKAGRPVPVGYWDKEPVVFRSLLVKLEQGIRITRRDREAAARAVVLRSRLD